MKETTLNDWRAICLVDDEPNRYVMFWSALLKLISFTELAIGNPRQFYLAPEDGERLSKKNLEFVKEKFKLRAADYFLQAKNQPGWQPADPCHCFGGKFGGK